MFPYGRRRKKNKFIFAEISDTEAGFPTAQTPPGPQPGGRPLRRRPRAPPGPTAAGGPQLPRPCHIGNGRGGPGNQPRPAQGDSSPAPPRQAQPPRGGGRPAIAGSPSPTGRAPAAPYQPLTCPSAPPCCCGRGGEGSPRQPLPARPLPPAPPRFRRYFRRRRAPPRPAMLWAVRGGAAPPASRGPCGGRHVERGRHGGGAAASSPRSPGSGSQRGSLRTWQPRHP